MVRIVSTTANQTPTTGTPFQSFALTSFIVRRALEGKQIVCEFDIQGASLKLLRKEFSYPNNISDGIVVWAETPPVATYFIDFDFKPDTAYYYKLFVQDSFGIWQSSSKMQGWAFSCITGLFKHKLFELLPTIYQTEDTKSNQLTFDKDFHSSVIEYHHLNLDSTDNRGELYRFLILFGLFFDEIKCLIDYIPTLWDVDNAPGDFLQYIASIVGVVFNFDLPIDKQRLEIRDAVATYKTKGTEIGIVAHIQKITGFPAEVDPMVDNILVTNMGGRFTFDPDNPLSYLRGTCGDPYQYTLDPSGNYLTSSDKLLLCISIVDGKELNDFIVKKLIRTLVDWIPADTTGVVIFRLDNNSVIDTHTSPDSYTDLFNFTQTNRSMLLTNDGSLLTNVGNVVTQIF